MGLGTRGVDPNQGVSVIQTRRVWERVLVQIGDEATVETDLYAALVAIRSALEPYRSG